MTDGDLEGDRDAAGVERPSPAEAASILEAALERGRVVSIVGECRFDGPSRPKRAAGVRHVLCKPDGSVVVHGLAGTEPEAVLSGEGGIAAATSDGVLQVLVGAEGSDGRLGFERVDLLAHAAIDSTPDAPDSTEDPDAREGRHGSIRERLLAEPELVEPGFRPRSTERETAAGPVDVFGRDADGRAVVVEIKAHRAGPAAVGQLDRYVAALRRDLHADAEVRGVLVAPSATDRTRRLLDERGFSFRALSPGRSA